MEVLSATQLVQALQEYGKSSESIDFDDDFTSALETLKAQKISGKRFLKLETVDFSHLGIPYGVGMDLKALAGIINDDLLSKETIKCSTNDDLLSDSIVVTPKDCMTTEQNLLVNTGQSEELEEEEDDRYNEIKEFFSAEDFDEMSDYDKDVHLNLKRNYEKMCLDAPGWKVESIPEPEFMKSYKRQKKNTAQNRKLADPKPSGKQSSTGTSFSCGSKGPVSTLIPSPQPTESSTGTPSCSKGQVSSSFGRILRAQPTNTTINEEDDPLPIIEDNQAEKPKAKPVKKMAEKDYISTLPSFDIDDIISKLKGKQMRELEIELKKNGPLTSKHLKLLIRTLVLKLFCDKEGNFKRDTTTTQREGLAASVIMRCPFLKDDSDPTKWTWWRVYDRKLNRGRIPNVISNLQRKLDDENKPSRNVIPSHSGANKEEEGAGPSTSTVSIDEFSWLGLLVPSAGEHKQILSGMKESFAARKSWILSKEPTIHDVLEKFPHLISYNGEIIEEEFKLLHPKINHLALLQSFPPFISKLKSLETLPSLPENLSDDVMQGCLWLAQKMPWQNLTRFGKGKRAELIFEDLVQIIPSGINVREAIEERRQKSKRPVQPYLICLIPQASISKMFAVVDNKTVEIKTSSFVKGLDILFKIYHVFNVNYPTGWSRFLSFLEWGFYKIEHQKLTNTMKDLITRIEG